MRGGYTYTQTRPTYVIVRGAEFSAAPQTGLAPLVVTFTDTISQPATYRAWDFGDGSEPFVTADITGTHTYTTGVYTPTLTVVRGGFTYTLSVPAMILASQDACAISATQVTWWNSDFFYRQPIILTANASCDLLAGRHEGPGPDARQHHRADHRRIDALGRRRPARRLPLAEGWRDLPRQAEGLNTGDTRVYFPLQADIAVTDTNYYLYYGNAVAGDPTELYQVIESGPTQTTSGEGTFTVTPTVIFTADVYAGLANLVVSFTNLTTPTDEYQLLPLGLWRRRGEY